MNDNQIRWVWQLLDWPNFHWQEELIQPLLREVRLKQGILIGKTGAVAENVFMEWFNKSLEEPTFDPLLRAAISHFWFITVHPFEDRNGRITRALTDLALAQEEKQSIRLYAMSATILANRND
jgi:Fic family protein